MAQKSKACDTALNFALQTIQQKDALIAGQGKLIDLRGKEVANLTELDRNSQLQRENLVNTFNLEKSKLKAQKQKWRRVAFGQAVVIVIISILAF